MAQLDKIRITGDKLILDHTVCGEVNLQNVFAHTVCTLLLDCDQHTILPLSQFSDGTGQVETVTYSQGKAFHNNETSVPCAALYIEVLCISLIMFSRF